jgi:hypothetical protein
MAIRNTYRILLLYAFLVVNAFSEGDVDANWSLELTENDYEQVVSLHQESREAIPDEYATKEVRPLLAFRCTPGGDGDVRVTIDWRRFISSFNTEVGFKVDDKELLLLNWGVDRSNKVTAPRRGGADPGLIDFLRGGKALRVEVIPYAESLITISYDISGIDEALAALRNRCET